MKWVSETLDRFTSVLRRFDGARSGSPQRRANRRLNCRLQRLEQLEERALLSVGGIGANQETFLLNPMEDVFSTDLSILDDSTQPAGGDGLVVVAGLDQGDLPLSMPSAGISSGPLRTSLAARPDVAPGVRLPLAVFPSNPQTVGTSFPGINFLDQIADHGLANSIVPDTMGAVGPNHFVEVINSSVAIYNKLGTRLSHVTLDSFFATGAFPRNGAFDPRVLFDRQSGRWFATALERGAVSFTDNNIILAVSRTNDPTGGWDKYVIPVGVATSGGISFNTDYSTLGVDENGVYFGMTIFSDNHDGNPNNDPSFARIAATAMASLLAATPSLSAVFGWDITDMRFSPQPAYNFDSVGGSGRAWFVSSSTTVFANVNYRTLTWSGGVPTITPTFVLNTPGYAIVQGRNAPALGSTTNVNVTDNRLQMAVIRDNSLWTTRNVGVNSLGDSVAADRVGAEWLQLDVSTAIASLVQSGRVFDTAASDPRFYYDPSLMVNGQGHMAMGFSGSKSTEFIGAYTTGRLATDTLGTTQAVTLLKAGEAPYTRNDSDGRNRWGDYSYTSLDPNDDMTIWTIQEYAVNIPPFINIWGTTVAQLRSEAPTLNNPGGSDSRGATGVSLSLVGTGFYDPGSGFPNRLGVELTGGAVNGISNYNVAFNSPTSATVTFDVAAGASTGFRNLVLTNPDGQLVTVVNGFEVTATGAPEVTVEFIGVGITDGDTTPSALDGTDYGSVSQGGSPVTRTYTVRNDGTASLTLGVPPTIPTGFTVINPLNSQLDPGLSDTFVVRLDTATAGTKSGQISFATNDSDENPFNFSITGTVTATATLGDFVWQDLDGDGIQDAGEPGLDGVTVQLRNAGGLVNTRTTAGGGLYSFTGVTPGNYFLRFAAPVDFIFSPQDQGGNDALDSDANSTGDTVTFTLTSGQNDTTRDAGLVQLSAAGITVNPTSGLTTTEAGGTDTFTVVLDTLPTADVTIGLSSSNTAEGTVLPTSLTFTSANWNTPQIVTVTGVDDALIDGPIAYTIVTAAATSADGNYNGVNAADVSVTNTDNEAGIVLVLSSSTGTFVLAPDDTITVTVSVIASPSAIAVFQLNYASSDLASSELVLSSWTTDPTWGTTLDSDLSTPGDTFVAAGTFGSAISAPVPLGTFQLTAPTIVADAQFLLTTNYVVGGNLDTAFIDDSFLPIPISNFGDVSVDVVLDNVPPRVAGIQYNVGLPDPNPPGPSTWAQQRSEIRNIVVTFDEPMAAIGAADLVLTNLGVNAPVDPDAVVTLIASQLSLSASQDSLTINFDPALFPKLPDGVYRLDILATATDLASNPLDGNGDGTGGDSHVHSGNSTNKFFVLRGDFNGSGGVNIFDFGILRNWFGQSSPPAPEYVDLNNSGGINIFDFGIFRGNFGAGVTYPAPPSLAEMLDYWGATEYSSGFSETSTPPSQRGVSAWTRARDTVYTQLGRSGQGGVASLRLRSSPRTPAVGGLIAIREETPVETRAVDAVLASPVSEVFAGPSAHHHRRFSTPTE